MEHLLRIGDPLVLTGRTEWQLRSSRFRGHWLLEGGHRDYDYHLEFWSSVEVPSVFTVGLRIEKDQLAIHLDARQDHLPHGGDHVRGTHLHDIRHDDPVFRPPRPPCWPPLSDAEVTPGEYFETLRSFCCYVGIRMEAFRWVHPDPDTVGGDH